MNPKIYVYKMVVDNGGAPCVWHGLLSLAICKPMIRKSADEGDFIFGFGGRSRFPKEPLIYIAKVIAKPKVGDYYTLSKYKNRPDCIYHKVGDEARLKADARFHNKSDERKKDVGLHFENAHVLLSNDFRYFGDEATSDYKNQFPLIKDMVEKLRQGARVNHSPERYDELKELMSQTWRNNSEKQIGKPTHLDRSLVCNK